MKLIIDIDEEIYDSIKHGMRNRDDVENIMEQIENGIPLDDYDFGFCEDCIHRNESRNGIICRHCYIEKRMYEQERNKNV